MAEEVKTGFNTVDIVKYITDRPTETFVQGRVTSYLQNYNTDVNTAMFSSSKTISFPSLVVEGAGNYRKVGRRGVADTNGYSHYNSFGTGAQRDGYSVGSEEITRENKNLRFDRGKQFQIDYLDNEMSGLEDLVGNTMSKFLREQVGPEMDAVILSELAKNTNAGFGNRVENFVVSKDNILEQFSKIQLHFETNNVPLNDIKVHVSPDVMDALRTSKEITRVIQPLTRADGSTYTTEIYSYNGMQIIPTNQDRFYTNVMLSNDNGYYPTATNSKYIKILALNPNYVYNPIRLMKFKVYNPEQIVDYDGYALNFRYAYDIFMISKQFDAVYCCVGSDLVGNTAQATKVALFKQGSQYKVISYKPSHIFGTLVQSKTQLAIQEKTTIDNTNVKKVVQGVLFDPLDATTIYFGIIDAHGRVVSAGGAITLADVATYDIDPLSDLTDDVIDMDELSIKEKSHRK